MVFFRLNEMVQWVSEWISAQALGTLAIETCHRNQFPVGLGHVTAIAWIPSLMERVPFINRQI